MELEQVTDDELLALYRQYSEEVWSAGWMGRPEEQRGLAEGFAAWLRYQNAPPQERAHYETAALPTLRQAWQEAQDNRSRKWSGMTTLPAA